jgi:hypothetical protein
MDLPDEDVLRGIVITYARLRAAHGNAIGAPPLLQPTGEFFPDPFAVDAASVGRLVHRMMGYAPLAADLRVEVAFLDPGEESAGGCGSLACGSRGTTHGSGYGVEEIEDGYRVFVPTTDVAHSVLLTTSLARSVGALVLREAGEPPDEADDVTSEIAAVACGFGVLLANGAAVWGKSCGGLRMAQATALSVEEATVALALFIEVHGVRLSEARRHLETTQREALDVAAAWAESNPLLIEALRDRPASLDGGAFTIEPVRSLLGRWLYKRKLEKELSARPAPRPAMSEEQRRRLEEARSLVDEVLGGE